ncbi:hypothetical protein MMC28_010231 [Mycoblastus sanguinarius]|nr:hypothetical protein [Mycoblastus sanguinarius]
MLIVFDKIFPDSDACISLDKEVRRQNVLIVWTRDEDGLRAPISFDTIRSQSFPLARSDINTDNSDDVVRVSLRTAIRFILDLQQREEKVFPKLRRNASDQSIRNDKYVTEVMHKVDERGSNIVELAGLS